MVKALGEGLFLLLQAGGGGGGGGEGVGLGREHDTEVSGGGERRLGGYLPKLFNVFIVKAGTELNDDK